MGDTAYGPGCRIKSGMTIMGERVGQIPQPIATPPVAAPRAGG